MFVRRLAIVLEWERVHPGESILEAVTCWCKTANRVKNCKKMVLLIRDAVSLIAGIVQHLTSVFASSFRR
jgi:hypothetical protein